MDFLTDAYNDGGSTSHQALSGVFYLIQERNLDYPAFYHKLYSLLDASLLYSKHRSKFFRLLDTFLASTHLPATLVASFIKRLARLTLNGPPAGVVAVVPWIYNLLKKHPTCTFMIHREFRTEEEREQIEQAGLDDPFKEDEESPYNTNAYDSSLWEIVMLQTHYHPNVATIAKIISEQFTKHSYNLEDFLDHSYGSVRTVLPKIDTLLTCFRCLKPSCQKNLRRHQLLSLRYPRRSSPGMRKNLALRITYCPSFGTLHRWHLRMRMKIKILCLFFAIEFEFEVIERN